MVYKTEESVNCIGPGHVGDVRSWWNRHLLEDDRQFRTAGTKTQELFPMKDFTKFLCLGPAQITRMHEELMK